MDSQEFDKMHNTPWIIHLAVWLYAIPALLAIISLVNVSDTPFFLGYVVPPIIIALIARKLIYSRTKRLRVALMLIPVLALTTLIIWYYNFHLPSFSSNFEEMFFFSLLLGIVTQILTIPGAICLFLPPANRWYNAGKSLEK